MPITSSPLNLAQPRRRDQVGLARSQTTDTTYHFEAIAIARERLTLHVQDPFVHNVEHHAP